MKRISWIVLAVPCVVAPVTVQAATITNGFLSVPAFTGGHYTTNGVSSSWARTYCMAGRVADGPGMSEMRNWFLFHVPSFSVPLVRAEFRVRAGRVDSPNGFETYELHEVTTPTAYLVNYWRYGTNVFWDLADGPVFGRRDIRVAEGSINPNRSQGALLSIPFTPAGLAALEAPQDSDFAIGGSVVSLSSNALAVERVLSQDLFGAEAHLVLYFSNAAPPQVQVSPATLETLAGRRVTLEGIAGGAGPMAVQWQKDGLAVQGGTNEILEIFPAQTADSGNYQLVASNPLGSGTSPLIQVSVLPLKILAQPQSITVYPSAMVSFNVMVDSELPVTYQWRFNGAILPGPNFPIMVLHDVTPDQGGDYDVVVSNSAGSVTSAVARLTVRMPPPYFTQEPADQFVAVGLPFTLTGTAYGAQPMSYFWYKDGQLLPGITGATLEIAAAQFTDAGNYQVVITNVDGAITSRVARVEVAALYVRGPYSDTIPVGNTARLWVTTVGVPPVSYQWYFNNVALPGATNNQLRFPAVSFADAGQYYVIASNRYGAVISTMATLTVVTQAPTAYVVILGGGSEPLIGQDVSLYANAYGGPPPAIQWRFNGVDLPGETNQTLWIRSAATNDSGFYHVVVTNVYGATTSPPVHLQVIGAAPMFVEVPWPTNVLSGNIVNLRAVAFGGPPPTYQWRHEGVDMAGQTNALLIIPNVSTNDAGSYEIVARNEFGERRLSLFLSVQPSTGLDRWDWRMPKPQGSRLRDIAWGDGRYVAVGKAGKIITSTNGLDWVDATIEADCDLINVAYGNGTFVALGIMLTYNLLVTNAPGYAQSGLVLTSTNGLDWTPAQSPELGFMMKVVFGNGRFVAANVTAPPYFYVSTDGRHWTPQWTGFGPYPADLAFGQGRFIASVFNQIYYSTDLINWEKATEFFDIAYAMLEFGDDRFVATSYGNFYFSPDGVVWTEKAHTTNVPQALAVGPGRIVGALNSPIGSVLTSTDGLSWSVVDTGTSQEMESVIYAGGQYVAVGEAGAIATSSDGVRWTPNPVANRIDYYGLTRAGDLLIAAGDSGTILTSTDGETWITRPTASTRNLHAVHYAEGLLVAGGRRGTLMTSPDAVNWTLRASGITNYIERIACSNGLWVAVAEGGDICTSTNGVIWNARNTGWPYTAHEGIAFGKGVWVAVGGYFQRTEDTIAHSSVYTSTNGEAWVRQAPDFDVRLRDVTFARGMFVAVGNNGIVATSADGTNWIGFYIGYDNLRRVHYANGRFVAVGNDGQIYSAPEPASPSQWTRHRSHSSQNLHDIHDAADGTFLAVGNNGMILQSGDTRPQFTTLQAFEGSLNLEFDAGIAAGMSLESSTNLIDWGPLWPCCVTNPVQVPTSDAPARFFRLRVP